VQVEQKLQGGQVPLDQLVALLTILCSRKQQMEAPFKLLLAAYTNAAASAGVLQTSRQCWQIMRVCTARLHTAYVEQLAEVIQRQAAAAEAQGVHPGNLSVQPVLDACLQDNSCLAACAGALRVLKHAYSTRELVLDNT
jgi:hypothetical protein